MNLKYFEYSTDILLIIYCNYRYKNSPNNCILTAFTFTNSDTFSTVLDLRLV
jgi:hypothetical protein